MAVKLTQVYTETDLSSTYETLRHDSAAYVFRTRVSRGPCIPYDARAPVQPLWLSTCTLEENPNQR
jgi:hypothetical protein